MHEYESLSELRSQLPRMPLVQNAAFQQLDLREVSEHVLRTQFRACLFMGCGMDDNISQHLARCGTNAIFPQLDVPFRLYHPKLYDRQSIYEGYDHHLPETFHQSYDQRVYQHYVAHGKSEPAHIQESLARRIHDHSVTDALHDFIRQYPDRKIVAIMGGHGLPRDSADYAKVALISRKLAQKGYLMVSGGGPGAMEATHLGAWFAGRQKRQLMAAVRSLAKAPYYDPQEQWLRTAFEVIERYPLQDDTQSLGVPTWLYGHEPPSPFATHIAKYFANSVREEGLLAIAKGGVIYSPGSAGTMQEIFQDACQNHYISYEYPSPMAFLNSDYWTDACPVYPFLQNMAGKGRYKNLLLSIHDTVEGVVGEILAFTNQKNPKT